MRLDLGLSFVEVVGSAGSVEMKDCEKLSWQNFPQTSTRTRGLALSGPGENGRAVPFCRFKPHQALRVL